MNLPDGYEWRTYYGLNFASWQFIWAEHKTYEHPYESYFYQIGPFWWHMKVKAKGEV